MRRVTVAHRTDAHTLGSWSVFAPRALLLLSVLAFFAVQFTGWTAPHETRRFEHHKGFKIDKSNGDGNRGGSKTSMTGGEVKRTDTTSSSAGGGGGGVSTGNTLKKKGLCYENPLLKNCRHWLDDVLPRTRYDIVLVANELYPTFPLKGYGGIETAVEILADALSRMSIPFWVICPAREVRPEYKFDVMEALDSANGRRHMVGTFVWQASDIMRLRVDYTGARPVLIDALHKSVGSADIPIGEKNRSIIVWGQSDWSQNFAELSAVTITAHHDGGGPIGGWDWKKPYLGHRFLSHDQRDQWVSRDDVSGKGSM